MYNSRLTQYPSMLIKSHRRLFGRIFLVASLIGGGLWLRSLQSAKTTNGGQTWLPWPRTTMVTLYFSDGRFLFPVSRRMRTNLELPHAMLQALLNGPTAGDLKNPIPHDIQLRSFMLENGI